jgi:hypothetical protein
LLMPDGELGVELAYGTGVKGMTPYHLLPALLGLERHQFRI